ncbi:hypothetical protein KI688_002944 [Linnemannia hyalina]|uniref:Major facilitator superfamily (MFS) profile domain-containing protein n=1 Tax=Linnemannia hyalina TaxID=64524 RepID=A0A9P7XPA1_9FUNG|nr:hypothetical protein KI688_002944 [Linnemannia hyalina]
METFGPPTGAKELSWVGSLSCACIFVAAPAIVVLITNFGTSTVLASGVLCVTTGFVAASFATTYWHLYITVAVAGTERVDVDTDRRLVLASELSSPQSPPPTPTPTLTTASPAGPSLDFSLFKNLHYTLIFISTNLFALVYLVPILLTPTYATSVVGLPPSKGALMITIVSSVGIVSRIVIGHLADRYGTLNATILFM